MVGNDPIAVGVYRSLQKNGLHIPEDISIVSFDNIEVAEFLTPALNTVNVNTEEIGKLAVRMVNERIKEVRNVSIKVIVSNNIIVRESEKISIKKVNIQKRVFTFLFTNIFSKKSRQNIK
ncbi:substrate-binding domain-containing protein [Enterococcus lactis]|nr:substrate-binding domain-containing protein [Enterococcus lactis]